MENLANIFSQNLKICGTNDEYKLFSTFFENINSKEYLNCINGILSKGSNGKDSAKSVHQRMLGNELYKEKQFGKSIDLYTESLGLAEYNSTDYGIALANRSAAFYMLEEFLNSLADIALCLKTNYPEEKKLNLYLRQADCYYNLKKLEKYNEVIILIKQLFPFESIIIKDRIKYIEEKLRNKIFYKAKTNLPFLKNSNYLSASSKIKILFNEQKGRHVVANEPIFVGDILFVEKAFVFALVLDEKNEPIKSKCSFCLADIIAAIPCKQCTYCFYCNEDCRDLSWKESHQFECFGITLFYQLGIALPAFRCLMKGIKSNFEVISDPMTIINFGSLTDNYKYFNSLLTNITKMENVTPLLQTSAIIIIYLKERTNFFDWILDQPQIIEKNVNNVIMKIGGSLIRHIAQLMCNSSTISHWNTFHNLNEKSLLQDKLEDYSNLIDFYNKKPVACGIYPSISMMNHSCKSNITLYFLQDVVIAKAAENINIGEEIYNCYGIDYKSTNKHERQETLNSCYYFTCNCVICLCGSKEYKSAFNYFICKNCKERLIPVKSKLRCDKCKMSFKTDSYTELENSIQLLLQSFPEVDDLLRIVSKANMFLGENHDILYHCYETISDAYLNKGDDKKSRLYKRKCLKILDKTHTKYSRKYILLEDSLSKLSNGINNLDLYYPINEITILQYT